MLDPKLKDKADRLTKKAMQGLFLSAQFKAPWLKNIAKYEDAYNGKWKPKFRQMFSVPFPVFSGMVDTLIADFHNPISLRFMSSNPALAERMDIVGDLWKQSSASMDPDAKWMMQVRLDLKNAIMCGRGIEETFAESDPRFKYHFKAVSYRNFHCEPKGGPILDTHAFQIEEGVYKTDKELKDNAGGIYDLAQVNELVRRMGDEEYRPEPITSKDSPDFWQRFKSVGEDPQGFNFTGQAFASMVKAVVMDEGKRYYLLFDPYTQIWVRCDELKNVTESGRIPWTSWSTHEDDMLFWNKCFGNDIYPIHDSVGTLANQDLTFRQKKIMQSRAYDSEMFPDVSLLDETGYREGVLVPVDTIGGTRRISEGIYEFNTNSGDLSGTIDMVNWLEDQLGKHIGAAELNPSAGQKGKAAQVQYSILQQAEKRLAVKSDPRKEVFQDIGLRFVDGASEHMSRDEATKLLGSKGYGWSKIKPTEIITVKVIDLTEQDKENVLGKDQRIKAAEMVIGNPSLIQQNNPKMLNEMIWKDVGGVDQEMLDQLTNLDSFGKDDVMGAADAAIQTMLKGKPAEPYYFANKAFLQKIQDFAKKHQVSLAEKVNLFTQYIQQEAPIAQSNENQVPPQAQPGQDPNAPQSPGGSPAPSPTPVSRAQGPQVKRPAMAISGGQR